MEFLQLNFPEVPQFFAAFYNSTFFTVVKCILGFYTVILFLNIVMIILLRPIKKNLKEGFLGESVPAGFKSLRSKRWEKIKSRLERRDVSQYKVAILEADKFIDEIIGALRYQGADLGEKLANVRPGQLDNLDDLRAAHEVRNRVLHEAGFEPDEKTAGKVIETFEHLLRSLEFI